MTAIKALNSKTARAAKRRFMDAVSNGVAHLMEHHGYSRERATALLLHELKRDKDNDSNDDSNSDESTELLSVMKEYGIGLEEASEALVVSRAIQRATKERGLSVLEAIDDLTCRMNLSNLLQQPSVPLHEPTVQHRKQHQQVQQMIHTEPPPPACRPNVRKASRKTRGGKHAHHKRAPRNSHSKIQNNNNNRNNKRKEEDPTTSSTTTTTSSTTTRRTRSDSVTEVVIAKKAKTMDDATRTNPPNRNKRPHLDTVVVPTPSSSSSCPTTPMKRARTDT